MMRNAQLPPVIHERPSNSPLQATTARGGPGEISPSWCLSMQGGSGVVAVVVDCHGEPAPPHRSGLPPLDPGRGGADQGSGEVLARAGGRSELEEEHGPRRRIEEGEGSPPAPWRGAG